ncbi:hypothetical protein [Dyadobacter sp. OTU695]|uniref:hypothetical protein n=1 Tax=Dyadobacter sp. OTU695 TaxID=3043860 RepID=UPI00313CE6FF
MNLLKLILCSTVLATSVVLTSCDQNDPVNSISNPVQNNLVYKASSGNVTFNGSELVFENVKTFAEYQNVINSDSVFKKKLYKKYGVNLAVGQIENASFSKRYLFEKLTIDYLYSVNKDGLMIIGDEVVKFDENYQYLVPLKDRNLLDKAEDNIDLTIVKRDTYGIVDMKTGLPNGRTSAVTLPYNGSTALFYSFQIGPADPLAGQTRRFIHELFAHKGAHVGGQTHHRLMLRFRMQYPSGSNWYTAGELRSLNYRVWIFGKFKQDGSLYSYLETNPNYPIQNSQNTTNTEERVLKEFYTNSASAGTWEDVTVRGHITSLLPSPNGYPQNSYTSGYYVADPDVQTPPAIW